MMSSSPRKDGFRNRDVLIATTIAVVAAATIVGAWFFELVLELKPCPMCLQQRYAYYFAIPVALLVALGAHRSAFPIWLKSGFVLIALAALANSVLGGFHAGVEWKLWQGPTGCSGSVVNLGAAGSLLDRLDAVKVVRCDEVQWRFLGLSLAGYNVIVSLVLATLSLISVCLARKLRPAI
jgi:disulfide bond formation protein DsbB